MIGAIPVALVAAALLPHLLSDDRKDPASKALGKKGGKARAAKLTPEQRSEIARKAAAKRWRR